MTTEDALVRGAMTAARKLGVRVDRETIRDIVRSSSGLEDCAGRLADLLQAAALAQRIDVRGKVSDP